MWVVSCENESPPFTRVRLPPALTVIVPSTVNTVPEHTWGVVMTQLPMIAEPVWAQVCAAAGGARRDRAPIRLPMAVRATVRALRAIRASERRFVMAHTSEGPQPSLQAGAGGLRLGGHSSSAMPRVFI